MTRTSQPLTSPGSLIGEFEGAKLGDVRRSKRLLQIVERLAAAPEKSLPNLIPDNGELEAMYSFLSNEAVVWPELMAPHQSATVARCLAAKVVRILHDTTDFVFPGDRIGLGKVMQQTKGFFAHCSLAVGSDPANTPLGLLGMLPYVRTRDRGTKSKNEWKNEARERPRSEKESARWERQAALTHALLPDDVKAIHVMDQEGDDFAIFDELTQAGIPFVIRISSNRQVNGNLSGSLQSELDTLGGEFFRDVRVSARSPAQAAGRGAKIHPARAERVAGLRIRWGELELGKPQHSQAQSRALRLGVVQVFEVDPPPGEARIEWTLITSELLLSAEHAAAIVDHYRARWVIEEYFKALKTGCAIQERQLTTYDALVRFLATCAPIAWHLLLLRSLGRGKDSPPATVIFPREQLIRIGLLLKDKCGRELCAQPTVRDAMLAIAKLGGHIVNNGEPGWIVLARGYQELLAAERAWRALSRLKRCPES